MQHWDQIWAARLHAGCAVALVVVLSVVSLADGVYGSMAILGLVFTAGLFAGCWIVRRDPGRPTATEALHAKVFQSTTEGAIITDAGSRILAVNEAFTRLTGYAAQEVIGEYPSILSSGRHDAAFYNNMWDGIQTKGCWEGEVFNRRKSGEIYAEWLRISKVPGETGAPVNYIGVFSDITERKASEDLLVQHAYYDALTGAANRPYLNKYLDQEISRTRRGGGCLACLFLDLDKFKPINDNHGHDAGDEVLRVFVGRIKAELREVDLVSRIGGDEFVIALSDCGSTDYALQVANRILAMVGRPIPWQGGELRVGCSVGAAIFPDHADDRNSLIAAADKAMYRAKGQDGDSVVLAERLPPRRKSSFG